MSCIEEIPTLLKRRRLRLGLSLSAVARRAGTSPTGLSRYESGWTRFEVATLKRLASSLGCRLEVRLVPSTRRSSRTRAAGLARLRRLFWDHHLVMRDLKDHARWVVSRVVEHGDVQDIRFLVEELGQADFLALTAGVRYSSRKASRFWQAIREVEGLECMTRRSRPAAGSFWRP